MKMREATILLIDDDSTLLELLAGHLRTAGYSPLVAADGRSGLRLAVEALPDLVVLDVMMPGMDGWEVCQELRQVSGVPIIMLTAKGEEIDKLHGFHLGVDDYVTKPFSFAELAARVGAVLARGGVSERAPAHITRSDLAIDFDQHRVMAQGSAVDLTPTEYHLLETLARTPGRSVPSEHLLRQVWGPEYAGEISHVKHFIWSLRKKIEADPGNPRHILTERGFGYRLE
jgi:DNA-binding response OmpR family regulator